MFNKLHSGLCPCTTGKHLQPSNIYSLLKEDLSRNQKKRSITSSVTFYSFCLTHTNLVMRLQNHYVHPRTFSVPPLLLILWLSAIKLPFSDQIVCSLNSTEQSVQWLNINTEPMFMILHWRKTSEIPKSTASLTFQPTYHSWLYPRQKQFLGWWLDLHTMIYSWLMFWNPFETKC